MVPKLLEVTQCKCSVLKLMNTTVLPTHGTALSNIYHTAMLILMLKNFYTQNVEN